MSIITLLAGIGNFLQSVINFFFSSKWTIPIIVLIVIVYFIFKGMEKDKEVKNNGKK